MPIELTPDDRKQAIASIRRYFAENLEQDFTYWPPESSTRRHT